MGDWYESEAKAECLDLRVRVKELEAENQRLQDLAHDLERELYKLKSLEVTDNSAVIAELERKLAERDELLHELYSKACWALNNEDVENQAMISYNFIQEVRDRVLATRNREG